VNVETRQKSRAVFPHPYALFFMPAFFGCQPNYSKVAQLERKVDRPTVAGHVEEMDFSSCTDVTGERSEGAVNQAIATPRAGEGRGKVQKKVGGIEKVFGNAAIAGR